MDIYSEKYIDFTPKLDENWKNLNYENLEYYLRGFGCPLNLVNTKIVEKNINNFKEIYTKYNLNGDIFFAQKCSKSNSILRRVLLENIGVDCASKKELELALSKGFTKNKIEATGPKNDEFLELLLRNEILINIDSIDEVNNILNVKKKYNLPKANILVRLSNFSKESTNSEFHISNKSSKFGISIKYIDEFLKSIKKLEEEKELVLKGFSFHLDTISLEEKLEAIEKTLEVFEKAYNLELNPDILNIGGGFKISYIEDIQKANNSIVNIKKSLLQELPQLTYNNTSFGVRVENNTILGNFNIGNGFETVTGPNNLISILESKLENFNNQKVYEILNDNLIKLYIEPGKALLDQAGVTLSKVNFVKNIDDNERIIGMDMKNHDILISNQDIFIDPIHFTKKEDNNNLKENKNSENNKNKENNKKYFGYYMGGNLCMENDIIYRYKLFLENKVKKNDIFMFANTAGYFMDFNRSDVLKQKIARTIVLEDEKIYLDEEYLG